MLNHTKLSPIPRFCPRDDSEESFVLEELCAAAEKLLLYDTEESHPWAQKIAAHIAAYKRKEKGVFPSALKDLEILLFALERIGQCTDVQRRIYKQLLDFQKTALPAAKTMQESQSSATL